MRISKTIFSVATAAMIGLSLAAGSSDSGSTTTETSSEAPAPPEALAQISILSGESTAVALDQYFLPIRDITSRTSGSSA